MQSFNRFSLGAQKGHHSEADRGNASVHQGVAAGLCLRSPGIEREGVGRGLEGVRGSVGLKLGDRGGGGGGGEGLHGGSRFVTWRLLAAPSINSQRQLDEWKEARLGLLNFKYDRLTRLFIRIDTCQRAYRHWNIQVKLGLNDTT